MKRKLVAILLILALTIALAACGGGGANQSPSSGTSASPGQNTPGQSSPSQNSPVQSNPDNSPSAPKKPVEIKVAFSVMPNGLEPIYEDLGTTLSVTTLIYDKLVELDRDLNMIPGVAKTWKQVDDVTWQFEINTDMVFQNGDKLTMDDVVFSFERLKDIPKSADVASMIQSVSADGNTLTLKIKAPNNTTIPRLLWTTIIVNKKYITTGGDEAMYTKPIGTGPYKVTSFTPGATVVLESWDGYALEKPQIDKITFVAIPENSNRYIAVESGQAQYAGFVSYYEYQLAEKAGKYNLIADPGSRNYNITFNCQRPPFDNKNVRRALAYAIDQEGWAEFDGGKPRIKSLFFITFPIYREAQNQLSYNLEKAKEMLEAEGYNASNPLKFEILCWMTDPGLEMYQSALKSIGVDCTVTLDEFSAYIDREGAGDYDAVFGANKNIAGTALMDLERIDSAYIGTRNIARYSNPIADELVARARVTLDPQELADITDQLNDIVAEDVPVLPICMMIMYSVMDKNLTGVYNRADQLQWFRGAQYTG